jgi:carotenoid 1,2-hydratase
VFSPWYRHARRNNAAAAPENHVAMNLALYGRGGKRWAMTERGRSSLARDASTLQIGPSGLHWDGNVLTAEIHEITAPWPSRLRGKIRVFPSGIATRETLLDGAGLHRWSPIAPGSRVEVEMTNPDLRWQGTAYLDTNSGDAPLEEGFQGWDWSRTTQKDGMAVLYHGTRRGGEKFCFALHYDKTNTATDFKAPPEQPLKTSFWRLPRSTRAEAPASITQVLEDAPFYARSVLRTKLRGEDATAVHESLSLDRFTAPWVQLMLPFKAPRTWGG